MEGATLTITAEDVIAARKSQKLSRKAFAELVGLTPTKVYNIEKGRALKPDEIAALEPHVVAGAGAASISSDETTGAGYPDGPSAGDIFALTEDEEDGPIMDPSDIVPGSGPSPSTPTPAPPAPEPAGAAPSPPPAPETPVEISPTVPEGWYAFTNSELRTFKRCRRKWYFAYYRRLGLPAPEVTGVRAIGTRIHAALALYYVPAGETPANLIDSMEAIITEDLAALMERQPMQDQIDQFTKDADLCRAIIEGYVEWLAETGADQFIEVVAPETKVFVPIDMVGPQGEKVALLGKLDVRIRRTSDGARMFVDHKTVGSITEPVRTLHMDEQMLHYHLLEYLDMLARGAEAGERTDGGLYNMLRKVKRTARATPPFYDRVEIRHSITMLRSYYTRLVGEIEDILATKHKLDEGYEPNRAAYPMPTKDCTWDCDFFHLCTMMDDGSRVDDFIAQNLITVDPHLRYEVDTETTNKEG